MPDVFLSYNREDAGVAKLFADAFVHAGLDVWWDATLRSGEAYDQVTEEALRGARAVVVLWSARSVQSRWVRAEATLADRNRTLLPARIEPCDLPIMFELTQTANLSGWHGDPQDKAWQAFLEDVRRLVEVGVSQSEPARVLATQSPSRHSPRSKHPSIAVLPFINRSGIAEDSFFADCMAEDITAALSVSRRIKVLAASATAAFKDGVRDLRQIARDLGVRYLLEGNVRRVGTNLRVTAQLEDAETSDILWTQKFDRPFEDIAALQEDLVVEVAAYLGAEVQRVEMEQALRKPDSVTAWEAILRADAFSAQSTLSGYESAVVEARRAVELDPDFGPAYATLAANLSVLRTVSGNDDPEVEHEILDNIDRARAREPNNPLVLCRIATALTVIGKAQAALSIGERAVAANPNLEASRMALGATLLRLGRWDEAIEQLEVVARLAPRGFWFRAALTRRSQAHFCAGRFNEALELAEQGLCLKNDVSYHIIKILCLARLDRWIDARHALECLCDSDTKVSLAMLEGVIRLGPLGTNFTNVDDLVSIIGRLWDAIGGDG
jgi:TolB-like protein